ncbi:general substrate transporter [Astrocystis sublimbata]|nr:general substrate transporter [Astrocystis sublimbata]
MTSDNRKARIPITADDKASELGAEHIDAAAAHLADHAEHDATVLSSLKTHWKAVLWSGTVSMALVMESYVLQTLAAFNAQPAFSKTFGVAIGDGKYQLEPKWQVALANASKIGIIIGLFVNGILIDKFGCKRVVISALAAFTLLNLVVFFANRVEVLFAGELLVGLPLGVFNTLASVYATEVCPLALRGVMTGYVNLCWVIGHLIGAGVLAGVADIDSQWGYRIPFAIQWVWPVPLFFILFFAPESPWWLVRQNRYDEAGEALNRLSVPRIHGQNNQTVALMRRTVELERATQIGSTYAQCFNPHNGSLRRLEICAVGYSSHTWAGFILQNYVTYFFKSAGLATQPAYYLSIGAYAIAFAGTVICFYTQGRFGRRTPFLLGWGFMTVLMWAIGGLGFSGDPNSKWAEASLLLIWFATYGLTVGPIPYIFSAEMPSDMLRAKTVQLARIFYYLSDIINGVVAPYAINPTAWNLQAKAALIPAAVSTLLVVWTYFRLPETNRRTYEELDLLFEAGVPARQFKKYNVEPLKQRAIEHSKI